ncbi:MAG: S8/S53 family peptidase, partial [Myxococcota bacterium]
MEISDNVQPELPILLPLGQNDDERVVARYQNTLGSSVDFVQDELIVQTSNPDALDAFIDRWNGVILGAIDPSSLGGEGPAFYRVRIDLSRADLSGLEAKWARANGVTGTQFFSDSEAVSLLAAALAETDRESDLRVSVNPVLQSDDIPSRFTQEDASGPGGYVRDAYQWTYMNRASEQDIGTAEAWTLMDQVGRLNPGTIQLGIADGGFIVNSDFPPTLVAGRERLPNPSNCGGTPCPWHGSHVALAAAALPDNGIGVAGPAGPVASLTVLPSPAPDFFAYLQYIFTNIPGALGSGPQIIDISASIDMPAEMCLGALIGLPVCEALNGITSAFRNNGAMIFASAGNDGKDIDRTKQFILVTEESEVTIPCELEGVICVGGLAEDSNVKANNSAFGSNRSSDGSVDIYGPFTVFTVNDPSMADDDLASPDLSVRRINGTSFASPYVAGVAALIWAANPALTNRQVEDILITTAHTTSSDSRVHRWVNALAGVQTALGRDTPPFLRIIADTFNFPQGSEIDVSAAIEELQGQQVTVTWTRAGTFVGSSTLPAGANRGTQTVVLDTSSWPVGENVLEAVAVDSAGNASAVDSVVITLEAVTTPPEGRTVTLGSTGALCPQSNGEAGDQGDAEFGGAPDIDVTANLSISSDRRNLVAEIF